MPAGASAPESIAPSKLEALKAEQARMAAEIGELRALVQRMARDLGIAES